jgi:hypothetical protein
MRKTIQIFTALVAVSAVLSAQDKFRGLSAPGSIGKKEIISSRSINVSDMACSISFEEPSGDNILSEDETGSIKVLVKNTSSDAVIEPKLDISVQSSWSPAPKFLSKWIESVAPGETGEYTSTIKWDEKLPSGTITYKVKAVDSKSGVESVPIQVSFNVIGKGTPAAEPAFVDVDGAIPTVPVRNYDAVAVVIGNRSYSNPDVPEVAYADNDADAVRKYLIHMLGFREDNILFLKNAVKADFERIFGTRAVGQGKLFNMVKPNKSDVFIYYSGHGAPDLKTKKAYFMPVNSDPNYILIDGYPLDVFYTNLEKVPAKSVTVILDACFSGGSQKGMIIKNASPMYIDVEMSLIGGQFNLLTSASGDQISSWYPEGKHSLFTYYFLHAIRGEADGNKDRKVTVREVQDYINENVPYMARRKYGREQTPVVKGDLEAVICTY